MDQRVTLLLGYLPQELNGTSLYEHIQYDDIPAISECHRNALKSPQEVNVHHPHFTPQFLSLLSSGAKPVLPVPSQRRKICEAGVEVETVPEPLDEGDRVPDLQEPHVDHQREDGGRGQLCGERRHGVLPEWLQQGRHRVRVSLGRPEYHSY